MKEKNLLKKMALDAKNRLKHMNYADRQQSANVIRNIAFQNHVRHIAENGGKKADLVITVIDDFETSQRFEHKVYELLNKNEDCLNPIKELCDVKLLKTMSETEKQKYIFELADKYTEVRNKFYKQKQAGL